MLGAVFNQEMLLAGRQDRLHQLRWAWAGLLLAQVFQYLPMIHTATRYPRLTGALSASAADQAFQVLAGEQLVVLALLAPLFTATVLTEEKAKGTLLPLLATQLTPARIVLEKFAARLAQLLLLALTGLPMLAAAGGFAQRPFLSLAAVAVATLAPVVALSAAGLLASVWCRTSIEATLATYFLLAVLFFAVPSVPLLEPFDPDRLFRLPPLPMGVDPTDVLLRRLGGFSLAWGGVTVGSLFVAAWRLRPAYFRQMEARPAARATARPAVDDDPLCWKELHADGLLPFPMLRRLPHWLPWVGAGLASAVAIGWSLWSRIAALTTPHEVLAALLRLDLEWLIDRTGWGRQPDWMLIGLGMAVLGIVAAMANVRGAAAFTAEREGRTWDTLLLLPLSGLEIVHGKLRGIRALCWRCLAAAAAPLLVVAGLAGPETFLGVLLPLMLALPFTHLMAALGLSLSLRFQTTAAAVVVSLLLGLLYAFGTAMLLLCCGVCQLGTATGTGALDLLGGGRLRVLGTALLLDVGTVLFATVVLQGLAEECLKAASEQLDGQRGYRRPRRNWP